MPNKMEKPSPIRVYVGSISSELAKNIAELESRFSKFGSIEKSFSLHTKEIIDYHYGYLTMSLTEDSFKKLRKTFNGVNYKGSKLVINKANESFEERWLKDSKRQDTKIKSRKIRARIAECRSERIEQKDDNSFMLQNIIKGRHRKTVRKDLKKLTLRVNYNNKLKVIRCKHTKVWGYNKNKKLRDLVSKFIEGEWKDGNDHVIDRLTRKVVVFTNTGIRVVDLVEEEKRQNGVQDLGLEGDEVDRNNKLLENLLGKYNFDKPVELQKSLREEDDDYGESDYEFEGIYNCNSDDDDDDKETEMEYSVPEKDCIKPSHESIIEEYKKQEISNVSKMVYYSEDDDLEEEGFYDKLLGNDDRPIIERESDIDMLSVAESEMKKNRVKLEKIEQELEDEGEESDFIPKRDSDPEQSLEQRQETEDFPLEEDEAHDYEFMPKFGSAERKQETDEDNDDEFITKFSGTALKNKESISNTEALRDLLNPVDDISSAFKLVNDDDEDIDQSKNFNEEVTLSNSVTNDQHSTQGTVLLPEKRDLGLFFSYFQSPFLIAQSQLNKLSEFKVNEKLNYDDWFWKNRGELNREFRGRRRDVLRGVNKKSAKSATLI